MHELTYSADTEQINQGIKGGESQIKQINKQPGFKSV